MSVETRFVAELLKLGAFLNRTGGRLLSGTGLSQQQFVVLKAIQENGPLPQGKVCSKLLFEKSNVSKAISRLSSLGLITRRHAEQDGRVVLVDITPQGQKVVDRAMEAFSSWSKDWLESVPPWWLSGCVELFQGLTLQSSGKSS